MLLHYTQFAHMVFYTLRSVYPRVFDVSQQCKDPKRYCTEINLSPTSFAEYSPLLIDNPGYEVGLSNYLQYKAE